MNETIASALSNEEVKDILTKFVQTNTVNPPGNEKVLAQWIADDFKKAGIEAEVRDMGDGRANVVARIKRSGERKALLFDGHLDTVPPGNCFPESCNVSSIEKYTCLYMICDCGKRGSHVS